MTLFPLRPDLQITPSPDPQRPGLVLRDQYRFSDAVLVIPPLLARLLPYFDGAHDRSDLEAELARSTDDPNTVAIAGQLLEALDTAGFLLNETFTNMRDQRMRDFAESDVRKPAHAGGGYPLEPAALHRELAGYLAGPPVAQTALVGIAAPHVSPFGGWHSYGAAYRMLGPELRERTFVILGTSHYGAPNRFGLTRKPFETPFGRTRTDRRLVDELAQLDSVIMEDYCHAIEHSIEFQVVFLQHLYGPEVRILPVLCGSFYPSIAANGKPEDDEDVRVFFQTLRHIAERENDKLFWVLGVDMAHIGVRYGDAKPAYANIDHMAEVRRRDHDRIASLASGDANAFWEKIRRNGEDLRWCGSSPLYTYMNVMPRARAALQCYEQWNIDPQSVVTFAGLSYTVGDAPPA